MYWPWGTVYLQKKSFEEYVIFLRDVYSVKQCYGYLPCEGIVDCNSYPIFCGEIEQRGDVHFKGDMATTVVACILPVYVHSSCVVDRTKPTQKQVLTIKLSRDVMSISKEIWPPL